MHALHNPTQPLPNRYPAPLVILRSTIEEDAARLDRLQHRTRREARGILAAAKEAAKASSIRGVRGDGGAEDGGVFAGIRAGGSRFSDSGSR